MSKTGFWQLLADINRIEIPLIQRDYAQGRPDAKTREIAARFVDALANAIEKRLENPDSEPLFLDFIFGSKENEIFIPYDGQQRLTTLWLLHLYAAYRANRLDNATKERLERFRYAVREDTSLFTKALLNFLASGESGGEAGANESDMNFAAKIQEQAWFLPQWKHDSTIHGMLNMLDYLDKRFNDLPEAWDVLSGTETPPVQFAFQDVAELKTTGNELFIKMNARGKQLTDYEIFKSRFLEWLELHHPDKKPDFTRRLNVDWQNLFWRVFGMPLQAGDKARYADSCFCRFLGWLAEMLLFYARKDGDSNDLCKLIIEAVEADSPCDQGNLWLIERSLNALLALEKQPGGVKEFFDSIFLAADDSVMPVKGKISWFRNNHVDLFDAICAADQQPTAADRQMLFAILLILAVKGEMGAEARLHLRILRNLFANSPREMYEAKFPDQMQELVGLVLEGILEGQGGYNGAQLKEEQVKLDARQQAAWKTDSEKMDWLEDHPLLRGCLAMFSKVPGARNEPSFEQRTILEGQKFFETALGDKPLPWDTVLQGFLRAGEFGLHDSTHPYKYMYLGAEQDRDTLRKINIFNTTKENSFPGTRAAVQTLANEVANSQQPASIAIANYASNHLATDDRMDWRWYFAKYATMRPQARNTLGRYDWVYSPRSFEQRELESKTLHGACWNPFLRAVYVEAGLEDGKKFKNRTEWKDSEGSDNVSQIIFHIDGCELALWPFEFFWWVNRRANASRLGPKQKTKLDALRKKLKPHHITMSEDGTYFIPGTDSDEIDYDNFDWKKIRGIYRLYDSVDRIQTGVIIAQTLAQL